MEASLKAANEVYAETLLHKPNFKKSFRNTITAYRSDQYLWWQVTNILNSSALVEK